MANFQLSSHLIANQHGIMLEVLNKMLFLSGQEESKWSEKPDLMFRSEMCVKRGTCSSRHIFCPRAFSVVNVVMFERKNIGSPKTDGHISLEHRDIRLDVSTPALSLCEHEKDCLQREGFLY